MIRTTYIKIRVYDTDNKIYDKDNVYIRVKYMIRIIYVRIRTYDKDNKIYYENIIYKDKII